MLTLESKFSDYLEIITTLGACDDAIKAFTAILKKYPERTVADQYKEFEADPNFSDSWCCWTLEAVGKELDEKIRAIIINKIKDPMSCLQLLTKCDFLTDAEHILLKSKYAGKLPTAEKEITDGRVILMTAKVAP